jgi:hypothetical protein
VATAACKRNGFFWVMYTEISLQPGKTSVGRVSHAPSDLGPRCSDFYRYEPLPLCGVACELDHGPTVFRDGISPLYLGSTVRY